MDNFLNEILKKDVPVNIIQSNDLRLIIQDDNLNNDGWESSIKVFILLLDHLSSGFIEKDTEDSEITDKITFLLIDLIGDYIRYTTPYYDFSNKTNFDVLSYFINFYTENKIHPDFISFINKYKD